MRIGRLGRGVRGSGAASRGVPGVVGKPQRGGEDGGAPGEWKSEQLGIVIRRAIVKRGGAAVVATGRWWATFGWNEWIKVVMSG